MQCTGNVATGGDDTVGQLEDAPDEKVKIYVYKYVCGKMQISDGGWIMRQWTDETKRWD